MRKLAVVAISVPLFVSVYVPTKAQESTNVNFVFSSSFPLEEREVVIQAFHEFREWVARYGINPFPKRTISIWSVVTAEEYKNALIRVAGLSPSTADYFVRTSYGFASDKGPIVMLSRYMSWTLRHELFHILQYELSGFGHRDTPGAWGIYWLTEGTADVAALHSMGYSEFPWRDPRLPITPSQISSRDGWRRAIQEFGVRETYRTAAQWALKLVERVGWPAVFGYFRLLRNQGPEQAFEKAFGLPLKEWEAEVMKK